MSEKKDDLVNTKYKLEVNIPLTLRKDITNALNPKYYLVLGAGNISFQDKNGQNYGFKECKETAIEISFSHYSALEKKLKDSNKGKSLGPGNRLELDGTLDILLGLYSYQKF
jgi:hypothetical protein